MIFNDLIMDHETENHETENKDQELYFMDLRHLK